MSEPTRCTITLWIIGIFLPCAIQCCHIANRRISLTCLCMAFSCCNKWFLMPNLTLFRTCLVQIFRVSLRSLDKRKRKNGIGILLCNSYTAYIQSFKLGGSGLWAVSIRPRWRGTRHTEFQVIILLCQPFRSFYFVVKVRKRRICDPITGQKDNAIHYSVNDGVKRKS